MKMHFDVWFFYCAKGLWKSGKSRGCGKWAEYIKFLWEEIVGRQESLDIVVYTDCKSLETALKYASMNNRKLRIDLAHIKGKIDKGVVKVGNWTSNKKAIEEVQGLREVRRERIGIIYFCCRWGRGRSRWERKGSIYEGDCGRLWWQGMRLTFSYRVQFFL